MLLIVDDDPVFLENARETLDHGRGIFLASDAPRARQLLDLLGTGLTVAMVDLDLPGEDGFSLIREMHRRSPELAIVAVSGVFQDSVLQSAKLVGASAALRKPVTPEWNATLAALRHPAPA
jgi:two-component system cell cycle sensor histidine kinase/response regulator CckA